MEALSLTGAVAVAAAASAAATALGAYGLVRRARLRDRDRLRREMAEAPVGLWRRESDRGAWRLSTAGAAMLGLDETVDPAPQVVLNQLASEGRRALSDALDDLITQGAPFELTVERVDGLSVFEMRGRASGLDRLVWLLDVSDSAMLAERYAERILELGQVQSLLQGLPWPVWWRDRETQRLLGGNAAYARVVGATPGRIADHGPELGGERGRELAERAARTGVAQSESHYVVVDGERRLLDLTEAPAPAAPGRLIGYAQDVSALEGLQEKLGEYIAAHGEVLERLDAAIAIYSADRRLTFHNSAFLKLWDLPNERLETGPTLGEVLELMRERRVLPEMVDFPAFKRRQDRLFTSLIEPQEDLLHLPDERTVRVTTSPHPQGGLIFVYEDVTARVALERSHNTLTAVQRLTLDSLYEAVAVFGPDGRLRLSNDGFARLFLQDPEWLASEPHISELVESARPVLPEVDDWEAAKRKMVLSIAEPQAHSGRMELRTNRIVDFAYVPLPDAQCLLIYLDVTDTVRVERALKERNAALENADLLKSQFISSISYELRSPLNAILGFTELLREQLFGPLNERQREQVGHIHAASQDLAGLINDILDLAALQAGYLAIERRAVRLGDLLQEIGETATREAAERGVTLSMEIAGALGALDADERRLRQAIGRILSTAIAYAPKGSEVRVVARRVDAAIHIAVGDPGHGLLGVERIGAIGEEAGARAGQLTGAGVGLALCKNLMELHGGRLDREPALDGAPGRIVLVLPVTDAPIVEGDGDREGRNPADDAPSPEARVGLAARDSSARR
ncbi:MAG: PAS-domain containing protein [Marivibrio sp.]|uniref:PAS domain-containing sensor histidine kinase n=1 Tax=Marivibrio sp. TaxID=2039719 RepID=UPI0032EC3DD7